MSQYSGAQGGGWNVWTVTLAVPTTNNTEWMPDPGRAAFSQAERRSAPQSATVMSGWMEKACCAQTQGLVPFGLDRTPRLLPWQSCPPHFFFRFVIRGYDVVSSERLAGGVLLLHAMQRALNAHSALGGTDQLWALGAHKDALMCIADTHIRQHMGGGKCTSEASPVHPSSV